VHTLGNLTLTAFNGTLSNNPFERKRQIYGASHLELNRALAEQDAWGRDEILARADELAAMDATGTARATIAGVSDGGVLGAVDLRTGESQYRERDWRRDHRGAGYLSRAPPAEWLPRSSCGGPAGRLTRTAGPRQSRPASGGRAHVCQESQAWLIRERLDSHCRAAKRCP
jgi:hypothetical protein